MNKILMSGNNVIGEAAIRAGCRFYAGYPITPQNELTEYMAEHMRNAEGGVFIQSESEVAAINMIAGAAAAGGLGAALALGGGGDGGGDTWSSIDDPAENVTATILKSPSIQTSCGTNVTNQLFVANNSQAELRVGTIDYEVVLKVDKPAGNCEPGQRGTFAPDGNPVIAAGDNVLIRQWSNVVNSCRSCPDAQAECVWESRYIVHTSAGSAVALATFTAEGDLCGTASAKSVQTAAPLAGDFLP